MAFWRKSPPQPSLDLEARIRALEVAQRELDADLDELYARMKRLNGRTSRERALEATPDLITHSPIDPISAKILQNRVPTMSQMPFKPKINGA